MVVLGVLLGLCAGLVLGAVLATRRERARTPAPAAPPPPQRREPPSSVEVIDALPVAIAVLDAGDRVVVANRSAVELGVVRGSALLVPELRGLVREARRRHEAREAEVELLAASRLVRMPEALRARLAPVGDAGHVALLVEDVTEARRVEAVRRDFVANVSHELKTPVGALSLLAEALLDASEDPDAVRRFGGRVQHEAARLARLVQELIDLSRLQGAEPLPEKQVVRVDRVVTRTAGAAPARSAPARCCR